jgi:hypothetical protein
MSALVDFIYFSLSVSVSLSLPAYEYDEGIQKRCACAVYVFCLLISLIVNQRRIRRVIGILTRIKYVYTRQDAETLPE